MNKLHVSTLAMLVAALAACGDRAPAPAQTAPTGADASSKPAPKTALGRRVDEAMDKARAKLATENISLTDLQVSGNNRGISISTNDGSNTDSRPKAEITPQGDLLIEGRKVQTSAQQHALLVDYRKQVEAVASAGMDIGVAGADLGIQAATQALSSLFSGGNPDDIEKRVEAEAQEIEVAARQLCDKLPAMLQTQTALAASLPEFRPYATMEQSDIDDCYKDEDQTGVSGEARAKVQQEVRDNIRNGVRSGIQGVAQAVGVASSGTGDRVTVNGVRFLLPPGGVSTDSTNGNTEIEVAGPQRLQVRLVDGELWVNDKRYPAPKGDGEVDLSATGTVKVDGKIVSAI